jgi:hypothetical protein
MKARQRARGRLRKHRIEPVERQISDLDHGWRGPSIIQALTATRQSESSSRARAPYYITMRSRP